MRLLPMMYIAIMIIFLVVPLIYLFISSMDPASLADIILSIKIPPSGALYTIYDYGDYRLIYIEGLDFGPLINSLILSAVVSLATLIMALYSVVASLSMSRSRWFLSYLVPLLASIPMPFISAYAVIHLVHRDYGLINTFLGFLGSSYRISIDGVVGVALYQLIHFYPLTHLLLLSYAETINRDLVDASSNLGGRSLNTIYRILIPLMRPAILAAWSLVFILSLEDLVGPIAFSRHNYARNLLSYQAYIGFISEYGYLVSPRIASYVLIMLVIAILLLALFYRYISGSRFGIISPRRIYIEIPGVGGHILRISASSLLIASLAPNFMVLIYSLTEGWFSNPYPRGFVIDNYASLLTTPYYYRAIINTILYTAISSTLIMVIGYIASYISMRGSGGSSFLVEALSMTPLVVPGVAVGIAYYQLFHSVLRGSWADPVYIPWIYLLATYTIRRLPYMVRPVEASLQRIPRSFEEASYNLGSSPSRTMWGISFPMSLGSISTGYVIASIQVATEVSTSLILIGSVSVSASHPSPITPLIASLIIYDPQLVHRASALLIFTLVSVIIVSIAITRIISHSLKIPREAS